ncbi:MAG: hypothetical protein HY718_01240 [Planctomycetes bacterium]|nr:hypothetical protein [Planctomycetota bacterium]
MSRVLLTAPYVGEIGWELMSWQGRVRWVFTRGGYDRLVVLGPAGKAGFYNGMKLDYQAVDLGYLPGTAYEDRRIVTASNELLPAERIRQCVAGLVDRAVTELTEQGGTVDTLWPAYDGTLWPCDNRHQRFMRYERPVADAPDSPWVVLVARTRAYRSGHNWPPSHWSELARRLGEHGVRTSVYPNDSEAAIAMLSGCDLAVGQSTGGLHLAALCGCPTMVWSLQRYLMWRWEITNRQRYETWWNPLGSPVIVRELPQLPEPQDAARQVLTALRAIGRRTGSAIQRAAFRCKWAVRTALNRRVIEPRRYARWPWPVQKFVRYQLA